MNKEIKHNPPKLRKGQLCCRCFKVIKGEWAYNGKWWCKKCKNKDTAKRIENYLEDKKV
uniref:Uncharacterized protein n=1 Tax=viral metagenome TaxID=1070528 RepID=A0A6M3LGV5_9ZZZZ